MKTPGRAILQHLEVRMTRKRIIIFVFGVLLAGYASACAASSGWSWKEGFKREVFDNGMVVRVSRDDTAPVVSIFIGVRGGAGTELLKKAGIASLLTDALFRGSAEYEGEDVRSIVEERSLELKGYPTFDGCYFRLRCLRDDLPAALDILADALTRPKLGPLQVRDAKFIARNEAMKVATKPASIAVGLMLRLLYPDHRYSLPVQGAPEAVRYIAPEDVNGYYKLNFQPQRTVVAVAGDFDTKELMRMLREKFGGWKTKAPEEEVKPLPRQKTKQYQLFLKGGKRAYIAVGTRAAGRTSEDELPLEALVYVLGGDHPKARLHARLVEDELLATDAAMRLGTRTLEGPVYFSITTGIQTVYGAMTAAFDEIEKARKGEITEEDLQAAKDYLKGRLQVRESSLSGKAGLAVEQELYGLPADYWEHYSEKVDALAVEDLVRVAQKYLDPDTFVGGVVTSYPDQVIVQVQEFGDVERVRR